MPDTRNAGQRNRLARGTDPYALKASPRPKRTAAPQGSCLAKRCGGKAALAAGHTPEHSKIHLRHAGARRHRFHPGSACPPKLQAPARTLFDADKALAKLLTMAL